MIPDLPAALAGKIRRLAESISKAKAEGRLEKDPGKGIHPGGQRGIRKGKHEAPLKIVPAMLQNGIDHNTAMTITGMAEDDLQRIRPVGLTGKKI
ncbi:hypothetical protein [Kosakonia oryziphila]|jgi:conserved hypothetical protein (putative transposase or invertase) TIGR01784|nr:hypothetical protein [Kosakonia oryziphila]